MKEQDQEKENRESSTQLIKIILPTKSTKHIMWEYGLHCLEFCCSNLLRGRAWMNEGRLERRKNASTTSYLRFRLPCSLQHRLAPLDDSSMVMPYCTGKFVLLCYLPGVHLCHSFKRVYC